MRTDLFNGWDGVGGRHTRLRSAGHCYKVLSIDESQFSWMFLLNSCEEDILKRQKTTIGGSQKKVAEARQARGCIIDGDCLASVGLAILPFYIARRLNSVFYEIFPGFFDTHQHNNKRELQGSCDYRIWIICIT